MPFGRHLCCPNQKGTKLIILRPFPGQLVIIPQTGQPKTLGN
jgi:hypothetical protein